MSTPIIRELALLDRKVFGHKGCSTVKDFEQAVELGWTIDVMCTPETMELQGYAVYEKNARTRISNIYRIVVAYDWRNMGIGSTMMNQIKSECNGHILLTMVPFDSARWFVNKHKFSIIPRNSASSLVFMECKNHAVSKNGSGSRIN